MGANPPLPARAAAEDLSLVLGAATAQLSFVRNVALGMMAPVPYATRIAKAAAVLTMGFLTGEWRDWANRAGA